MRKAALILATVAALGVTAVAAPAPAEARGGFGPGLAGGLIAGALIGGIASNAYGYGPGYGYYGGGYAPGYYGGGYAPAYYGGYSSGYYDGARSTLAIAIAGWFDPLMLITAAHAIMVVGIIEVIATGKLARLGPRCGNVAGSFTVAMLPEKTSGPLYLPQ